jgi:hypothetical protein
VAHATFTFLYEAATSAPGSLELENWITWQRATGAERFDQVDFRHELEYGVTELDVATRSFV